MIPPLSDLDAALRGLLQEPFSAIQLETVYELELAAAGTVACPAVDCTNGKRNEKYRPKCKACNGTGEVSNGHAELAELMAVGEELAPWENVRDSFEPIHLPALRARERELITYGRTAGWWEVPGLGSPSIGEGGSIWWLGGPNMLDRITATLRHGFPSAISLPAAAFTEPVARAVFERFPILEVRLSDIPQQQIHDGTWVNGPIIGGAGSPQIPTGLWDLMCEMGLWHQTRELALTALSHAATDWARSLVSWPGGITLPPLCRDLASTVAT